MCCIVACAAGARASPLRSPQAGPVRSVDGTVTVAGSTKPVVGATVYSDRGELATTDLDGYFTIELSPDEIELVVTADRYASRTVRIEFDANLRNMPWAFRPITPVKDVHPGELAQVEFEVVNATDHPVTGQAIPSYGPQYAAQYFKKLECFCFAKQTLGPGEIRRMPVVFVVDPTAPKDLATITLSYTFFAVEGNGKG